MGVKCKGGIVSDVFESGQVVSLVGIRPFYLNKFIERKLYGIRPSFETGKVRKVRRKFSADDVCGIGLVWWLYESGLRSEAIKRVLRDITGAKKSDTNEAARLLRENKTEMLAIVRHRRTAKSLKSSPDQIVKRTNLSGVSLLLREKQTASVSVIPVGVLFTELSEAIEPIQEGGS
jgi:hypothetical protein